MSASLIDMVTFDVLVRHRADPCVSLVVPVDRRHPDERASHLLLKQLVADARTRLTAAGVSGIDEILGPTDEVLQRPLLAEHSGGLGLFLSRGYAAEYPIDTAVEASVVIDDRFSVGPLLSGVATAPTCHALTLSADHVGLWQVSGLRWTRCDVPDLPQSVDETLWYERVERASGSHAGGPVGAAGMSIIGHGSGAQEEDRKERLARFFQIVDDAVMHHLRADPDGLLVVLPSAARPNWPLVTCTHAWRRSCSRCSRHRSRRCSVDWPTGSARASWAWISARSTTRLHRVGSVTCSWPRRPRSG
jgi:hypothetical protein